MNTVSTNSSQDAPDTNMGADLADSSAWARLGSFAFRRRRWVLGVWVIALVGVVIAVGTIGAASDSSFESPDSESSAGFDVIEDYFGGAGSFLSGNVVFEAEQGIADPEVEAAMTELLDEVASWDDVSVTSPYSELGAQSGQISPDGTIAFASVDFDESVDEVEASEAGGDIAELIEETEVEGLRIEIGGASLSEFEPPESELIGLAFAIVILILSFGSVLAMGLPIGVALFGVGIGVGMITLLSNVIMIPDFATTIGAMIGLGVGIDYALFIVTRYREGTKAGMDPHRATVTAIDTAGRAVVFAGITVVISLLGMYIMGLEFINGMATGAATTVAITMVASVTLLPALIGFAQNRVEITRWRGLIMAGGAALVLLGAGLTFPPLSLLGLVVLVGTLILSFFVKKLRAQVPEREQKPLQETVPYRWSRVVQRNPWPIAIGTTLALLLMTIPLFGIRLGFSDESTFAEDTTTRQAYELLADGFGPGSNGPLIAAGEVSDPSQIEQVGGAIVAAASRADGVAAALGPIPSDDGAAFLVRIIPETGPQEAATADLVRDLRADVIAPVTEGTDVEVYVSGTVAAGIDFSDYLGDRMPYFFVAVLGLSFLLLMMVFRSLLVPLKAVVMNLLSISAAYGIVVAIFQWGWGIELFNTAPGPIEPFLPMMMFAIVFGLSMDYEVFLLSRVKEEYDRTEDPRASVADGLAATARVITAAAAIMVVVFGSFVLEDNRIIKMFGVGLAVAVLLDATLVRMLLVPATMELMGEGNWWLPRWLDRILPTLNVEGSHEHVGADLAESDDDPDDGGLGDGDRELVGTPG